MIRFNARDRAEMRAQGIRKTDPNNGRCRLCKMVIWYAELWAETDGGKVHESCRSRQSMARITPSRLCSECGKYPADPVTCQGCDAYREHQA